MAKAARSQREKSEAAMAPRRVAKCPICGEPAVAEFFPFSSKRCADVDLNRWLSGRYFIPAVEAEPEAEPEIPTDEDEG